MRMYALALIAFSALLLPRGALNQGQCPQGSLCPASYPIRSDPGGAACDDAAAAAIRQDIVQGVTNVVENDVTGRLNLLLRNKYLGQNARFPANSCQEIKDAFPNTVSGEYWLADSQGFSQIAYCEMDFQCGNRPPSSWELVAFFNMSDPTQSCPGSEFRLIESPARVCARVDQGYVCNEVFFSPLQSYSRVCGRVIGVQIGTADAFQSFNTIRSIDEPYLDGVSLTYGSPRQHVWSFASYTSEFYNVCPCSTGSTETTPSYVGGDYFCESGANTETVPSSQLFFEDPLWDGQNCRLTEVPCCNGAPWFYKELPTSTSDSLEFRLCSDQFHDDEDVSFQLIEIYVQ